ncbi:hypothetical protein [Gimesia algae]|uniref:Bacterial type II/III secretion system short domain protein n=1 Tax=Gimesia algae TaxID=2527971 RepID=A0A517V5V9_9PLAN|nr:hypothetical protein [Gimesia algae]QDT88391.1 hypothetical protein Pan161_00070 [Gimesia algae]
MSTAISKSFLKQFTLTVCFLSFGSLASAQSDTESRKDKTDWNKPIAVATIASIERVLDDIDYIFATVNKPEYPAMIKGFLAQYRNLEGLDKTKPLGAFVFLDKGISPQPVVVGFIPVKSLDELTQTLGEVGFLINPVEGQENRYTLALPTFSLHIKMAHGYAFLQIKSEALDRDFYNPVEFTSALAKEYDIAGALFLSNVPQPMRMMAVDLASASMDEKLQQKPGEEDLKFQTRKETSLLALKQFERVAQDGEQLTVGYTLSRQNKNIQLHLGVKARPDTPLGKEFQQLSKTSSQYSYLDENSSDYLGYAILPLRKEIEQKALIELLEKSTSDVPPVLLGDDENPGPVAKMLKSAKATIEAGRLDAQIQMVQTSKGKTALIASMKISEGETYKAGQQELFDLLGPNEPTPKFESNVAEIDGVTIHSVTPPDPGQQAKDLFGENPVIFIGSNSEELWLVIGENESLEQLKKAISLNKTRSDQRKPGNLFLVSIKFNPLIAMIGENAKDPKFVESAKVAFASGGDLMTIYPKITADQASLNLEFGEGFIRLISLAIANRK